MLIRFSLQLTGIRPELSDAVLKGLFEVTLGAKAAGSAGGAVSLMSKVAIAAFALSWAGLSVHAQVMSLLSQTNLRYAPFIAARFLHGLLSAGIVLLIWEPLQPLRGQLAVFLPQYQAHTPLANYLQLILPTSGIMFIATFVVISLLYVTYSFLRALYEKVGGTR
jgi:hypothetical protein